jgi:hypothetical protein
MRGKRIVVQSDPKGNWAQGYVKSGETFYPGMLVCKDPSVALVGGKHTYKAYAEGTDGYRPAGAIWIVTEQNLVLKGEGITDLDTFDDYPAGELASFYCPLPGDELNLLFKNVTGTGDDVAVGDKLTPDSGSGKLIVTTGTVEIEPAMALEALTDPTTDTLIWCEWSGF